MKTEDGPYAGPRVLSIAPAPYQSRYDTEVSFEVKFNKSVTGVDESDFIVITSSDLTAASIIDVAGQGSLWFVRVKVPVDSDGYVGIELRESGTGIVGPGGTESTGFSSGQYHYVGAAFDIEKAVEKGVHELPEDYRKFHFSSDGKKVFFLEYSTTRKIVEYDLATPYRIGTRETVDNANSLNLTIESYIGNFTFDSNGLKLFVFGHGTIYEYRLTKNFDLSTLVSTNPEVHNTGYSNINWVLFSHDGKKLFNNRLLSFDPLVDAVGEHNLSSPFVLPKNLSNARIRSKSLDGLNNSTEDAQFNVDGTKMYVLDRFNNGRSVLISENEMSDAYNVSKLEFIKNHDFSGVPVTDFMFNDDGTIMYILDWQHRTVHEWHMFTGPTTKSISLVGSPAKSANSIQYEVKFSKPVTGVNASDFELEVSTEVRHATISSVTGEGDTYVVTIDNIEAHADGHIRLNLHPEGSDIRDKNDALLNNSYIKARYHYAGAAYDVSRAFYKGLNQSLSLSNESAEPRSFLFNQKGDKVYVMDKNGIIRQYNLSTAYDVSTASYAGVTQDFSVAAQGGDTRSFAFNDNGTKMYVLGAGADDISEYGLSIPYEPSSATYSGDSESFSVKDKDSDPTSLVFNDDGTKMFVLGTEKDVILIYKLHLPFDVSTAVYQNARNIANFETNPYSLAFNSDGTKMYILGADGDDVSEFRLAGPYQPIGAVYAGDAEGFSTRAQDNGPRSIAFANGGATMYVLGKTSDRIHKFDLDASPPRLTEVTVFGNPEPTATSVRFFAYFNESVTGVDESDFVVKGSKELSGASVTDVHKSGLRFTVTVSGIPSTADGTLTIGLKSSGTNIRDVEGQEAISGLLSPEYHYVGTAFNTAKAVYAGSRSAFTLEFDNVTDMAFGKEGKSLFILTDSTFSNVYEYVLDVPYEVSSAITPPTRAHYGFITGSNPTSIYFNNDGTLLSVLTKSRLWGHILKGAYTFYTQKWIYSNIGGLSIEFNNDGKQMFVLKESRINSYRLDKPYKIDDAVLQNSNTSFLTNEANPGTLRFNLDGTRLFVLGNEKKKVQFYNLTTPFDLSTLQYSGDVNSMNTQGENIASPEVILFNEDGTGLFVLDKATSTIHKYYMDSNPAVAEEIKLDGNPLSHVNTVDFNVAFSKNVTGVDAGDFDLKVSEELEGASITSVSGDGLEYVVTVSNIPAYADGTLSVSLKTSDTGIKDEVTGEGVTNYVESDVHYAGAAFDISRAVFTDKSKDFSVKDKSEVVRSFAFSATGDKMFVLGKDSQTIYEYQLSEPFAIATATFTGTSFSVAAEESNARSITFSNDGKALFVLGTDSDKVHRYKLIRPYDLSTANLLGGVVSFSVKEKANDARSLAFSRSGDKMFVLGASAVKAYDLPIPFDITTANFLANLSIADQEDKAWSLAFNLDGTKMYVLGNDGDKIVEYKLQKAYDITTAVYSGMANELSVAENEETPRSMHFNQGGTKLFVMGNEGDDFYEYDLNTAPTTVTITSDAPQWVGDIFNFTITFSSPVTGFDQYDISTKNGKISSFKKISPTVYTAKIDPKVEGEVTVKVAANKAKDIAENGNIASGELLRIYDQYPPIFTSTGSSSIEENSTTPAYDIDAATIRHVDIPYPRLIYGLGSGHDESLFNVNSNGWVTFKSPPDYESPLGQNADNTYKIEVTASDEVYTSTRLVTITVNNVIDNAPVFTSPKNVTFAENETSAAYHPKATKEEKVTFGFSSAYDRGLFKWENGRLFFKEAPDFESPQDGGANNTYKIQVNANEGGLQTSQVVTVTVTNVVNEGKPRITSANGRVFYENNTGFAYKIVAVDENPLTYRLGTNKDEALFNITDNTVYFNSPPDFETPLDANANNVYEIKVIASDGTYETAKTVNITVRNRDEIPPVFTSANQTNFTENGTGTVYTALATDEKTVTYELGTGNDEAFFNLSESTGLLTFKNSPDFEDPKDADGNNSYLVEVLAKDRLNTSRQVVTVNITNIDDTAPVFTSSSTASFVENGNGTAYTATTTDENTVSYSLGTAKDEVLFNLDVNTGVLTFKSSPDFESPQDSNANNTYLVEINGGDGINTSSRTVTISVTDVDEVAPVFVSGTAASIAENSTGTVYEVKANDASPLNYALGSGADEALFNLSASTGLLTFKVSPDFEDPKDIGTDNDYVVNIVANDGNLTTTQQVTVSVTNIDDTAPVFTSSTAVSFQENGTGTAYTAVATDANTLTFALGTGLDETLFNLASSTGVLTFKTAPDFENPVDGDANNTYQVSIKANDGINSVTQTVTLTVANVDDTKPVFTSATTVVFAENGTGSVYQAQATDANALTYSLGTAHDESQFNITGTGLLTFKTSPDFESPSDADANNTYLTEIKVSDGVNLVTQVVTVSVTNLDEVSPTVTVTSAASGTVNGGFDVTFTFSEAVTGFESGDISVTNGTVSGFTGSGDSYSATITPVTDGTSTVKVAASVAQDASGNANEVSNTFSIITDSSALSVAISSLASVKTNNAFDITITFSASVADFIEGDLSVTNAAVSGFAGTGNSYSATVTPTAGGVVTIDVPADVATNGSGTKNLKAGQFSILFDASAPVFTSSAIASFAENATGTAHTVVATDDNALTYSLGNAKDEAFFDLSESTGVITFLSSPDFELPTDADKDNVYSIEVKANDGLNTTSQVLFITVTDIDDTAPVFTSSSTSTFAENGTGTAYTAAATDANVLTYSLGNALDEALFDIVGNTGLISFKVAPDFEMPGDSDKNNTYVIQVTASDGIQVSSMQVTITVSDVDDTAPVFTSSTSQSISENTAGTVYTASASDASTVTYSLGSDKDEALFDIIQNSGTISFKTAPDFEAPSDADSDNAYLLEIKASDGINLTSQVVTVQVMDVDDTAPVFISASTINFAEESSGTVFTVQATDTNAITYTLGNGLDESFFNINGNTGVVTFLSSPDFESPNDSDKDNVYKLEVKASDGANIGTQNLSVTITNVDDTAPVFTSSTSVSFLENGTGTAYTALATDANPVTYSLGTGNDGSLFQITGAQVQFKTSPDFDNPADADQNNSYILTIIASDGVNEASQLVTVAVTDTDDTAPVFSSAQSVTFQENALEVVYEAIASDLSTITYSLGSGRDESFFDMTSEEVSFKASPDFESPKDADQNNSYVIEVLANDGINITSHIVTISVTDVDDTAPLFTSATTASIVENTSGKLYTVAATDENAISYSLGANQDEAYFSLTGEELSFKSVPDFEQPKDNNADNTYLIELIATDGANAASLLVTISVTDLDEVLPVFTSSTAVSFTENTTGTAYSIVATDANAVTYSLGTGHDEAMFDLSNGALTFKSAPDFENPADKNKDNTYEVEVKANDGLNTAMQLVEITVTDTDDTAPVFTSGASVNYVENGTGTTYTITATDANPLTYTLGTGNDENLFNLDGKVLTFKTSPDFETALDTDQDNDYLIEILASDGPNTTKQMVTVTVIDIDEIMPVFISPNLVEVAENTSTEVYKIAATDANSLTYSLGTSNDEAQFVISEDQLTFKSSVDYENPADSDQDNGYLVEVKANDGTNEVSQFVTVIVTDIDEDSPVFTSAATVNYAENGSGLAHSITATDVGAVTYTLGSDNDEGLFNLNEGVIAFKTSPNFEAPADANKDNNYIIEVQASDGVNTAKQTVTITVIDVDETLPVFTSGTAVDYAENGTDAVYTVAATDANTITYALGSGNDESAFTITEGVVSFITSPDFETKNSYIIEVHANDGLNTAKQAVTITITDVDEIAPVFTSATAVNYAENGTDDVYTVTATDAKAITYALGNGNDESAFTITEGVVSFIASPDFETKSNYTIEVQAHDGLNTARQVVTITITDVDEIAPVFTSATSVSYAENGTDAVYIVTATDANAVTYSLGIGNDESDFTIADGVVSFIASPDFEAKNSYIIEVHANDGLNTAKQAVTITITDVDEIAPEPSLTSTANTLVNGSFVLQVTYSESVSGFTLTDLQVTNGTASNLTVIVSGEVWTVEITPAGDGLVTVELPENTAVDAAGNSNVAAMAFSITSDQTAPVAVVSAISIAQGTFEVTAQFSESVVGFSQADINVTQGEIANFMAIDTDTYTFELSEGSGVSEVFIDANLVTDLAGNGNTTSNVIEVVFNSSPTDIVLSNSSINENNELDDAIGGLSTIDEDAGDSHTYTLVNGIGDTDNASFSIVDGVLVARTEFDFETKNSYSVRVRTEDDGGLIFEKALEISITDVPEPIIRLEHTNPADHIPLGLSATISVEVFNDGDAPLQISNITYPEGFSGPASLADIAAGSRATLSVVFMPLEALTYSGDLILTYNGGVENLSLSADGAIITSVDLGQVNPKEVKLYPNPASRLFTLDLSAFNGVQVTIGIATAAGAELQRDTDISNSLYSIDVSRFEQGMYIIVIQAAQQTLVKKLMIKR